MPYDEADSESVHALIDKANKTVRLYRGKMVVSANESKEIRFSVKKLPKNDCRIEVGAASANPVSREWSSHWTDIKGEDSPLP
jgi:hypothetical protein